MHLLLVAATAFEIAPASRWLEQQLPGQLKADILITGIGSTATALALGSHLQQNHYQLVMQAGVAGCFESGRETEVLAADRDRLGDLGVWEDGLFRDPFAMGLSSPDAPLYRDGWLYNPYSALLDHIGLPQVSAITVNQISTDIRQIDWYKTQWNPLLESMEGAALHLACLQRQIPFVQLRAVSNQVGVRDKSRWQLAASIENLNKKLIELFQQVNDLPL
ncbi:MAG: futalosine hydrolase [Sphingobacteriales bacterium]|nr:futalosine hydrolase [Sphingobacteriales bacterium]NCT76570.1 futalosine hydrolase [Chitinophagaceae bacterium]OJW33548.1 MAG: futalosine hydrolase [Sphingobacteriales bacterium 46-32]